MNLKIWSPLAMLDETLFSRIRLVFVFKYDISIFVNDDDEVLAFGDKVSTYLNVEDTSSRYKPVALPKWQKKEIKGLVFGGEVEKPFVAAYTHTGEIYFWGILQEPSSDVIFKPRFMEQFTTKISNVACGAKHFLALSVDGEVFSWGINDSGQLGIGPLKTIMEPMQVRRHLKGQIVVKISCGSYFSAALLHHGDLFVWGANLRGQLGQDYLTRINSWPVQVCGLNDVIIRKIACGPSHVLAVSDTGDLYVWGRNVNGELGLNLNDECVMTPKKNNFVGRVTKVAASIFCHTSAALSVNNVVFYWGKLITGYSFFRPRTWPSESLHEVFAHFAPHKIMYKAIMKKPYLKSECNTIANSFDKKELSDLTIVAEGREIFVHRTILRLKSMYFQTLLKEHWVDKNEKTISINQSYAALHAYLQYLYTEKLKVDANVAAELFKLAHEYNDTAVKQLCEKIIRRSVNVDNVTGLYALALKLDAFKLREKCLFFADNHMTATINSPGYDDWDFETIKRFFLDCSQRRMFKS